MNVEVETLPETLDDLLSRHRKEKKDLQNKIQALRKSATKGDKKKKKEVTEEILKLETELEKKQSTEVASMNNGEVDHLADDVSTMAVTEEDSKNSTRVSKAQKRRTKKAMLLKEQELRIAEQEAQNIYGARNSELQAIQEALKDRGLMIQEIPSDGDCLYNAVRVGLGYGTVAELRKKAAQVLRENLDEFLPFLSHPDTGEILTEEQYHDYCNQVENTKAWGGHIELKAVSQAMDCCIEVVQGNGSPVIVGPTLKDRRHVIVTYHRHLYGLGEHYNSVQPYVEEPPSD